MELYTSKLYTSKPLIKVFILNKFGAQPLQKTSEICCTKHEHAQINSKRLEIKMELIIDVEEKVKGQKNRGSPKNILGEGC